MNISIEKRPSVTVPNAAIKALYKLLYSPNYYIDPSGIIRAIVGSSMSGNLLNQNH